jgi:hypothetical protein
MNRHAGSLQKKSKSHEIAKLDERNYKVTSGATGKEYTVTMFETNGASCTCDWMKYRPAENNGRCGCSHVIAVIAYIQKENERTVKTFTGWEQVQKAHRQVLDIGDGLLLTTRKVLL